MSQSSDLVRLLHMRDAAREAVGFLASTSREQLDGDRQLVYAVVYTLLVIGEAAGKVTRETRDSLPRIPWAEIVAMRNHLVHGYADVDHDLVWQVVRQDLPQLLAELDRALDKAGS